MNYKLNFTGDEVNVLLKKIQDVTHTPAQLDKAIDDFFALNEKLYIEENNLKFDQMFTDLAGVTTLKNSLRKETKLFRLYFEDQWIEEHHGNVYEHPNRVALKLEHVHDIPWQDMHLENAIKISLVGVNEDGTDTEDTYERNLYFQNEIMFRHIETMNINADGAYIDNLWIDRLGAEEGGTFIRYDDDFYGCHMNALDFCIGGGGDNNILFAEGEEYDPDEGIVTRHPTNNPDQIRLHNIADPLQPMEGANKRYVDNKFVDLGSNIFTVTDQDIVVDHQRAYKIGQLTFMHLVFHRTTAPSTTDTVKIGTMSLRAQHDHSYAVAGFNSNTGNCIIEAGALKTNGDVMIHFTKSTATSNVSFDATFFFVANQ